MNDTICAIGTPVGMGGISIIRISGPDALKAMHAIFFLKKGKVEKPRYAYLGDVQKEGDFIDKAIGIWYQSPFSYTGEDVCEIQCHGGMVIANMILDLLVQKGLRPAEPGEFTKRAFLNGKIALDEAEAVQDHISAMSVQGAMESAKRLEGKLTRRIQDLQSQLTDVIAKMEAAIEYPEDELPVIEESVQDICRLEREVARLLDTYDTGKMLKEGVRIAICGTPNVGKSSILNAILGENRAIVTNIPGTTRDVLKEYYVYKGVPLVFLDTAGIRETEDVIEKIGVDKSLRELENCDIALLLLDSSREISHRDIEIMENLKSRDMKVLVALNKVDLEPVTTEERAESLLGMQSLPISAATGQGVKELLDCIYNFAIDQTSLQEGLTIANLRHKNALLQAKNALSDAKNACAYEMDADCISIDLMDCWRSLGEITGETVSEDIVDRIFSKFCLGK